MLAFGRPAHAYDLAKLSGAVVARRARDGEQVAALNDKTYTLDSEMTVIADDAGVHDIAGIMGGAAFGRAPHETTDVLLEIAYFDPERIGATGPRARPRQRCAHPVRARGRSGVPRRRARNPDRD